MKSLVVPVLFSLAITASAIAEKPTTPAPMTTSPVFKSAVLFVQDMPASRRFYEGVLGLKVELDLGVNVGYLGGVALWQRESAAEHIQGRPFVNTGPLGRDNFELYFEMDEIEAMAARFEQAGVRWVHRLKEQAWGQRVVRVYDPDGHIVEVGETMPQVVRRLAREGVERADIVTRTGMPRAFVDQALDGK